jgi:glycosyltransferase involved in cell wall biosynthesis
VPVMPMSAPGSANGDRRSRPSLSLSVVVPAHNEEAYLEPAVTGIVEGIRARGWPFELLVCENGSRDRTAEVAATLAERFAEVRALSLPVADYGRALRAGFSASSGELVANFDVDLVDLGFLDRAAARMAEEPTLAVVLGSKRSAGAEDRRALGRRVVTAAFAGLMRYGFGLRASDTHGLKLLRREPLAPLVGVCASDADIFDTELILRAERAGLPIAEIPVTTVELRPPRTPIWSRIPRTLAGLARLRLALWRPAPRAATPLRGPGGDSTPGGSQGPGAR